MLRSGGTQRWQPANASGPLLQMTSVNRTTPTHVYIFLVIGVLAASSAAILITYAIQEGVPTVVIAAGRLSIAALLLTPFTLLGKSRLDSAANENNRVPASYRGELARLSRRDLLTALGAGFLLSIHFASWIASLEFTSVLISVVIVTTGPLWVALMEFFFLRVIPRPLVIIGLIIAIVGGVVIGLAGAGEADSGGSATGAILALVGAITFGGYLVMGRRIRAKLNLIPYIWLVYGIAAIFLVAMAILSGASFTGYSTNGYILILLLALAPQLIGHTSFNNALKYLSATYVSIASQMEPIGSAIAAALLFSQFPAPLQLIGCVAILIGVLFATLGQREAPATVAEEADSL